MRERERERREREREKKRETPIKRTKHTWDILDCFGFFFSFLSDIYRKQYAIFRKQMPYDKDEKNTLSSNKRMLNKLAMESNESTQNCLSVS
jgi:hypothetical protein